MYKTQDERQEQDEHTCRTHKTFFFAHSTEDKVGILFWNELQFCLRTIQKALSLQTARANGNLALVYVLASTFQVFLQTQKHINTNTLVGLHHVVKHVIGHIIEQQRTQGEATYP